MSPFLSKLLRTPSQVLAERDALQPKERALLDQRKQISPELRARLLAVHVGNAGVKSALS